MPLIISATLLAALNKYRLTENRDATSWLKPVFRSCKRYMPMKILSIFILALTFSVGSYANDNCKKVVSGYEKSDLMYVVCPNLPNLTLVQMNTVVKAVMAQNSVVEDEILVYFVATKDDVGNDKLEPNNFIGYYYTHDSVLTLWPEIKGKKKDIQIYY